MTDKSQTTKAAKYQKLWGLAERADWYGWPPKFFWRWLLKTLDKANGHELTY